MSWRAIVVLLLVILALANAAIRLWGNWPTFFAVLGAQAFFIFGGIYPYFFKKSMLGFPGTRLKVNFNPDLDDTDTSLIRLIFFFGHTFLYFLMFLAS